MLKRLQKEERWMPGLFAWMMIMAVVFALGRADLIRDLDMLEPLVLAGTFGFIGGIALALSRFPNWTAHLYSLSYGLFVTGWLFGREAYPVDMVWRNRVADMVTRQADWFTALFNGTTNRDGALFLIHTTAIVWLLAYTMAWFTYRKPRLWRVVLPSGMVLASVVYNYFGSEPMLLRMRLYMAIYCILSLIYIAVTHLIANKEEWNALRVRYEGGVSAAFLRSSIMLSLVAMLLAWSMPTMAASGSVGDAVNRVNEPWREFRDQWQRMYSALSATTTGASDPYRDSITLGGPRSTGDSTVMDIYVDEKLPYAYWREAVMDRFDGVKWYVAPGDSITHFPDDGDLDVPRTSGRKQVQQTVVNYIPNASTLYSAPDMLSTDRQMIVRTELDPSGANLVYATRSRYLLQQGDRYDVTSQFSVADETSLRGSGSEYPAHITEQYLGLSDTTSERTIELAAELTSLHDNPFDKTLAVRNYLRRTIDYNDQVPAPPSGVDAVDYVLFETREGYCNYYAGAMAIMLRSQDIPARVSRGFAAGEFNEDNNLYRVRARDAHTWVEVYFNDYGWIPFEPTAAIDIVDRELGDGPENSSTTDSPRPEDQEDLLSGEDENAPEEVDLPDENDAAAGGGVFGGFFGSLEQGQLWRVIGAVSLVLLATILYFVADRMNRRVEADINGSYSRLGSWGRLLGVPIAPSQTPYERADVMVTAVPSEGESPIRNLTSEYVRRAFSRNKKPSLYVNALSEWKKLRPILIKQSLRNRFMGRRR